uniref:Uncharacterized protein n=1 Tax=Gasterosteus aculeatus TaxID=69293 RepID=G3NGF4_GASAC
MPFYKHLAHRVFLSTHALCKITTLKHCRGAEIHKRSLTDVSSHQRGTEDEKLKFVRAATQLVFHCVSSRNFFFYSSYINLYFIRSKINIHIITTRPLPHTLSLQLHLLTMFSDKGRIHLTIRI